MKSIQSRLAAGLFLSLLSIFIILWFLVSSSIVQLAENYIASRLQHDIETLLSSISFDQNNNLILNQEKINPIYKHPFSGHYYSINYQLTVLRSRSLWDQTLSTKIAELGEYTRANIMGPEGQPLLVINSQFKKQGRLFSISVAEDLKPIITDMQKYKNNYTIISIIALLLLLIIQILILRRGLKPLMDIKNELTKLEQGRIQTLNNEVPQELQPLTNEVNHLLSILHQRLKLSRDALSDLSHAIKKPLTVLLQLTEHQDTILKPESITLLNEQIKSIQLLTDRILKRAKLAGNSYSSALFDFNTDFVLLLKTIEQMYPHKNITTTTHIVNTLTKKIDREDMLELLGNLIDNAYKWTKDKIVISINETQTLNIIIEDNGLGAEIELLKTLGKRGVRLDESTHGHGFGLAISSDIISAYNGTLGFGVSAELGGFKVEIRLPLKVL
ncbi:MAG: sensor histidine kinase [Pseudomonadota bacterium]